jgi:C4-dicarboxylate transporter
MLADAVKYFDELYRTLEAATGDIALVQAGFTQEFTEAEHPVNDFIKGLLTVFAGVVGMLNAYVGFAAGVSKAGLFDGKLIDKGSAGIAAATSAGLTAAKDSLPT